MATPNPLDYTITVQERTLDSLKQSQAAVVEAVGVWAKAVETAVPDLPAVPVLKGLPTLDEIIKTNFDFAGKLLAAQKTFAQDVTKAAKPAIRVTPLEVPTA